ncbi:calcium-dependent protein kinase, putative [Entamoeba invadens IP1]|uniref:non-specific serine/threonine protein kinase n=1 Tax=Entamoeba invadens IP1 TaxID=370355 RepID=A0A0A1UGV1_ENTIV|nr:calcium-dependent protein kinase, putative [Entamoeba invadens IP1]ELP95184.1 calcium-dependent protein kinase, putative [Entamoeba invadens IP1]|eukprot:XP_004261955.1 calcium-dependent protein kinase, putative [Entamoeba invadens IP1]
MNFFHSILNTIKDAIKCEDISKARYTNVEKLHTSQFSKVYKCQLRDTMKDVCVKIYQVRKCAKISEDTEGQILNEISIIRKVNHPCILGCSNVFLTSHRAVLEMDFMHGGDLYDYLVSNGIQCEKNTKIVMLQLLSASRYLHSMNIVHRDIKLENILLTRSNRIEEVKLSDFGLSVEIDENSVLTDQVGTSYYMAPELYRKEPYGFKVDIWACGVVMYSLLFGKFPFDGEGQELVANILRGKFTFPKEVSDNAKSLLKGLLATKVTERFCSKNAVKSAFFDGEEIVGDTTPLDNEMINCKSESLVSHMTAVDTTCENPSEISEDK